MRPIEHSQYWELPLVGGRVSRCAVDEAFRLEISAASSLTLVVEEAFTVTEGQIVRQFSPADRRQLGDALTLYGKEIAAARANKGGALEVRFADGAVLLVPPNPDYEAWELHGSDGLSMIGGPSGDVAVWLPRQKSPSLE